jgi:hypothetical protein
MSGINSGMGGAGDRVYHCLSTRFGSPKGILYISMRRAAVTEGGPLVQELSRVFSSCLADRLKHHLYPATTAGLQYVHACLDYVLSPYYEEL